MAAIDVSETLTDPDFAEPLTIVRRVETVGNNGRVVLTTSTVSPLPYGVVLPKDTAIGGNELENQPDMEVRASALTVYTGFRLRSTADAAGTEYKPDLLIYNGDQYLCTLTNSYSHFGAGFVEAEFISIPSVDSPPT